MLLLRYSAEVAYRLKNLNASFVTFLLSSDKNEKLNSLFGKFNLSES